MIGIFVVLAKISTAIREIAIASRFGTSGVVDAFQLASNITTWLPMVIAGASTGLLVPRLVAVRRDPQADRTFAAELNGATLAVATIALICTAAAAFPAVEVIGEGLDAPIRGLALTFTLAMLPVSFMTVIAALFYARLQAKEQQAFALTEAISPLLVAFLVLAVTDPAGLFPIAGGTVAGGLVQLIALWVLVRRGRPGAEGVSFSRTSAEWRHIGVHLFTLVGAQALVTLSIPLDSGFASHAGEGAIATYGYANRLLGLFISFGALVFARAILPILSDVANSSEHDLGRDLAARWSGILLLVGLVLAALTWAVAPLMVRLAFERGAFTATDSAAVAHVLRWGVLQLPSSFGALAMIQWFAAMRRYDAIFLAALAAIGAKLVLNFLLFPTFGVAGLALAGSGMYAASMAMMLLLLRRFRTSLGSAKGGD